MTTWNPTSQTSAIGLAVRPILVAALSLTLAGCDPSGTSWPGATDLASDRDDIFTNELPELPGCGDQPLAEIVTLDIWGRPNDASATIHSVEPSSLASECAPVAWLSCGQTTAGDTALWNDGATDSIDSWPVAVGNYGGAEIAYAFRAPESGTVAWELLGAQPTVVNHDLFVLDGSDGSCESSGTMARGFNSVEFQATRGQVYFLVLDSFPGEEGPYQVRIDCSEGDEAVANQQELPEDKASFLPDGTIEMSYSAPEFLDTTLSARIVDGRFVDVATSGTARWAVSSDLRSVEGSPEACEVNTLYVGLDHAWYAASADRPPREGNQVELMLSGEDGNRALMDDLRGASEQVHIATWWWESDTELVRPETHWLMSEEERRSNTIMSVLDALPEVEKKVLVSRFCADACGGVADWVTVDDALVAHAESPGDGFEVALQGNPTEVPLYDEFDAPAVHWSFTQRVEEQPEFAGRLFESDPFFDGSVARFTMSIASYHQKMLTIDSEIAYLGGMNVRGNDWDTNEHLVFDPRRMAFESDYGDRLDVLNQEAMPDNAPRKDYITRIDGPIVSDIDSILNQRWQQAITDEEPYTEGNSTWTTTPATESFAGVEAQLQITMPSPAPERSILESLNKAFAQAQDYIYIEDQYWRAPAINEVLLATLQARPELKLVVVTSEVVSVDPAAEWSMRTDELFRSEVPDQYMTLTTRSFDWAPEYSLFTGWRVEPHLVTHSLHSKMVIVDDRYMSVGSANKNNRGMLFEGEANLAVLDSEWVREQRIAIFENLLGPRFSSEMSDDFSETWDLLREAANWNEAVTTAWHNTASNMTMAEAAAAEQDLWPSGFLYPLVLPEMSFLEPGPDAF